MRRPGLWLLGLLAAADVLVFGGLVAREEWLRARGFEVRLPVEGYDPRDLLSGHYVAFRLVAEREAAALAQDHTYAERFCLEERAGRWHVTAIRRAEDGCRPFLAGLRTAHGQVRFGVERFYVDERRREAVAVVRPGDETYLLARVDTAGQLHAVDLVVDGRSVAGLPGAR
jgi:uncharacterized membrane-anchored protein